MIILFSALGRLWGRLLILLFVIVLLSGLLVVTRTLVVPGIGGSEFAETAASYQAQPQGNDKLLLSSITGESANYTVGDYPDLDKAFDEYDVMVRNNDPRASDKWIEVYNLMREHELLQTVPVSSTNK